MHNTKHRMKRLSMCTQTLLWKQRFRNAPSQTFHNSRQHTVAAAHIMTHYNCSKTQAHHNLQLLAAYLVTEGVSVRTKVAQLVGLPVFLYIRREAPFQHQNKPSYRVTIHVHGHGAKKLVCSVHMHNIYYVHYHMNWTWYMKYFSLTWNLRKAGQCLQCLLINNISTLWIWSWWAKQLG